MQLATEAISKSQEIRRELRSVVDNKKLSQTTTHNTVNEGFTRKLAETVTLTVSNIIVLVHMYVHVRYQYV